MTYNGGPTPNQGPARYPGPQAAPTGTQPPWNQGHQQMALQGRGPSSPSNGDHNGNGVVVGAIVAGVTLVAMFSLLVLALSNRSEPTAATSTFLDPTPTQPDSLIGPNSEPKAETTTTTFAPETRTVSWINLTEGDCTNERLRDATSVTLIEVSGCETPHRFEVFAVVSPWEDDEAFPGSNEAREAANVECNALFDGFYGAPSGTNGYEFITLYPDSELAWTTSKEIVCFIGDVAQNTTEGSLRNAAG